MIQVKFWKGILFSFSTRSSVTLQVDVFCYNTCNPNLHIQFIVNEKKESKMRKRTKPEEIEKEGRRSGWEAKKILKERAACLIWTCDSREVSSYVFRPWTTYVQATLFVGLESLAVRCSSTKNSLATGRQNQLTRAAVFVPFRGIFKSLVAWVVWTSKIRGRNSSKAHKRHRNAACFEPRWNLTFSVVHIRGSKSNPGPCAQAWSGATCFALKHVQRNPFSIA